MDMKKIINFLLTAVLATGIGVNSGAQSIDSGTIEKIRQARYVASSPKVASLGLLHYSDIHGDDFAVARLREAISELDPYIDAVVNTGDVVHYYADATAAYQNDSRWWRSTGLAGKSLFVLGNHDSSIRSDARGFLEGSADWDFKGKEWAFDTYFSDYVADLGCVLPDGFDRKSSPYYKSCFWHKDFAPAKIRIIGLDALHFNDSFHYFSSEQESWLAARLAETLDPADEVFGYSVVILCHYPIDDFSGDDEVWDETTHRFSFNKNPKGGRVMDSRTGALVNFHSYSVKSLALDKRFSLRAKVADKDAKYGYEKGETNPLADIVQSWVDDGGKFVAWISGHCHSDLMFYPEKYPDLLCVAVDQAGNLRGNNLSDRPEEADSRFCANFYSIDTVNGLFKIIRLGGLKRDRFLVEKDVLCYDYLNKVVVFE